jgi:hypothetical protein
MSLPVGDHVVTGTLSGLEARSNGWVRYSITEPNKQYPVKVDTKKPEIINAAAALMGQPVSAMVTVQDSGNPNPHQPGQNFMNRYLNQIGPAGTIAAPQQQVYQAPPQQAAAAPQMAGLTPQAQAQLAAAQTAAQPQQQAPPQQPVDPFQPDSRDMKIYRQVAVKAAIDLACAERIPSDSVSMVQTAEVVMAYLVHGPARFGVTAFNVAPPQAQPQAHVQTDGTATYDGQQPEEATQQSFTEAGIPNVNVNDTPCNGCGAIPGELHADDCIPF